MLCCDYMPAGMSGLKKKSYICKLIQCMYAYAYNCKDR